MTTCCCEISSKLECNKSSCPGRDSDSDSDSDSDMEFPEPVYPSTFPQFNSDLECFEKVFPSLLDALNNAGDAFAIGWVAGCVHDAILCL